MNVKKMIAIFSMLVMCLAGVGLASESVDAGEVEELPSTDRTVTYCVGDEKVKIDPTEVGAIYTLKGADLVTDKTPTGMKFQCWTTDNSKITDGKFNATAYDEDEALLEGAAVAAGSQTVIDENLTYYAVFEVIKCKVTFKDGETAVKEVSVDYDTTVATAISGASLGAAYVAGALAEDESGYFKDWGTAGETKITADLTLTAVYTPAFKVTWIVEDVVVGTGVTNVDSTLPRAPINKDTIQKENYDFGGWTVDGVLIGESYTPTADVVIKALFTPTKLVVTFMDGETEVAKVVALYGKVIDPADIPAGYDWDFDFTTAVTENLTITPKVVEPEPEVPVVPVEEDDSSTTYVLMALFGIMILGGLVLGIRQLKKN